MASLGSEVVKDLIQVGEGVVAEVVQDVSDVPIPAAKRNVFFRFGQAIADVGMSLISCSKCKKIQIPETEAATDTTQSNLKPKS